jgi:hypothetical protein
MYIQEVRLAKVRRREKREGREEEGEGEQPFSHTNTEEIYCFLGERVAGTTNAAGTCKITKKANMPMRLMGLSGGIDALRTGIPYS